MAKPRIFLNYAREDAQQVEELYGDLLAAGTEPWIDTKDLLPGEDWKSAIDTAIQKADFVIVALSTASVTKRGFVQREIKHALELWPDKLDDDIYLIPLRLDECDVPSSLRRFQWVDLFEEQGFSRLLKAIRVGSARRSPAGSLEHQSPPGTSSRSTEPKFFHYISKAKVDMLFPQLQLQRTPQMIEAPLVSQTLLLIRELERRHLVLDSDHTNDIVPSKFCSSKSVWRNGLFYFRTVVSITVAYFIWKRTADAIFVLAGSPDNLIGKRVVKQGIEISSTGDAIDSISSMQILETINTDEISSVVVGGGRTSTRIPTAERPLTAYVQRSSKYNYWARDIYTHARELGLAIFCLTQLAQLPEMMIETVFRLYSTACAERGSLYDDLRAEYEVGRQQYPSLYTDDSLEEAQRIGLGSVRKVYLGSPLYTAIG